MTELKICHLYPDVLNLYGDRGNVLCMKKRLEWRGISCSVTEVPIGERESLTKFDLFFIGGGQDFEQGTAARTTSGAAKGEDIAAAVRDGAAFLCVCGGYQLMGRYYETHTGEKLPFIGALDLYNRRRGTRGSSGNFAFESEFGPVVGFENHSGRTYLGEGVKPLGRVIHGSGNNGEDGTEGARVLKLLLHLQPRPRAGRRTPPSATAYSPPRSRANTAAPSSSPLGDLSEREAHESVLKSLG